MKPVNLHILEIPANVSGIIKRCVTDKKPINDLQEMSVKSLGKMFCLRPGDFIIPTNDSFVASNGDDLDRAVR